MHDVRTIKYVYISIYLQENLKQPHLHIFYTAMLEVHVSHLYISNRRPLLPPLTHTFLPTAPLSRTLTLLIIRRRRTRTRNLLEVDNRVVT